jgi:hypothetical protein
MEKLLELLKIQKLEEAEQEVIKEKLQTLIEVKGQELMESKLEDEKTKLVEAYEEKFETYKEDITGKFSNFVDEILEAEVKIPEKVLEFARKGELYADLIEQFKVRLGVDEGLLDEEVKALLKEAREEIVRLRDELNESISDKLQTKQDATELAAEVYLHRKTDGLTEGQKAHVLEMLDGISDREEIDRKFDVIVEAYNGKNGNGNGKGNGNGNGNGNDDDEDEDDEDMKKKKKKKKEMEEALLALDNEIAEEKEEKDKKKKKKEKEMDENGKGKIDPDKKKLDEEDNSPFKQHLDGYVKVLQEQKV